MTGYTTIKYTDPFITVAKATLIALQEYKRSTTSAEVVGRYLSLISEYCTNTRKLNPSNNTSQKVYGQILLPDGSVYPRDNLIFNSAGEFGQRLDRFTNIAKHTSSFNNDGGKTTRQLRYEGLLLYMCYITLILINQKIADDEEKNNPNKEYYGKEILSKININNDSILTSHIFAEQANELFLYLSNPVLGKQREIQLFDELGEIDSARASELLFGTDSAEKLNEELTYHIRHHEWPNTTFGRNVTRSCAEKIVKKSMNLPLVRYYLSKNDYFKDTTEILFLFKTIVKSVINNDDITLRTLVSSIIEHAKDTVSQQCKSGESTVQDTLYLLGFLAFVATENELSGNGYTFKISEIDIDQLKDRLYISNTDNHDEIDKNIRSSTEELIDALLSSKSIEDTYKNEIRSLLKNIDAFTIKELKTAIISLLEVIKPIKTRGKITEKIQAWETALAKQVDEIIKAQTEELLKSLADRKGGPKGTQLIKIEGGSYQFMTKPLRLCFLALDIARQWNTSTSIDCEQVLYTLQRFAHISATGSGDYVTVDAHFDELVVLSSALMIRLREDHRNAFINHLCKQARDFSLMHRPSQIAAIYMLTGILYEDIPMTYQTRSIIFRETFGHSLYALQQTEWRYIRETPYYVAEVKRAFSRSSEKVLLDVGEEHLKYQPHYFFLFHEATEPYYLAKREYGWSLECMEQAAYHYRNKTWSDEARLSEEELTDISNLCNQLGAEVNQAMKQASSYTFEQQARLAYAIQAFLYTIANIHYKKAEIPDYSFTNLIAIMFYSDHFLRKHNLAYQNYLQQNLSPTPTDEDMELYLLCGAFRLTSSMKFENILYTMSPQMQSDYSYYLYAEKGRFKFLLSRLLSWSTFFTGTDKRMGNHQSLIPQLDVFRSLSNDHFLNYDNIDINVIKANPEDPSKWYTFL